MAMEFAVIGGDLRNIKLIKVLAETGNKVYVYGNKPEKDSDCIICDSIDVAIAEAKWIIGPIPFNAGTIPGEQILKNILPGKVFISGNIPESVIHDAQKRGIYVVDILQRDDMAILNAVPTAEGAIQIAMEKLPVTIDGSHILITGFGRVAKTLAAKLKAIGGIVTICARKTRDLAWAEIYGYNKMTFSELAKNTGRFTLIYNTVPKIIFDKKQLDVIKNCKTGGRPPSVLLLIDLASKPGGVDFEYAKKIGIDTVQALALPGKVAPETAARNIGKVVFNIIEDLAKEADKDVN
ncbi:MAG: dipicolinate synthase subunit DpsA [Ruminococcaceae bacterium]|nr:dipicolinate synthase subunit DpsA [Oscillospiraceae bacterium]